ncbi:MAG: GNAT family N-acetyltransferase [Pseudomonadota bacterium]
MVEIAPVEITPEGASDPLSRQVIAWLDAHAEGQGHPFAPASFGFAARERDEFVGGLAGHLLYGWVYVRLLAVAPEARGRGIASNLLAAAEAHGLREGALGISLDTFGFQALPFYEARGFREIGRLPGRVPAETRYYLAKSLEGA